jgi:SnoaL-like protein
MSSSLELFEISRLQARYGDVVTRQAWDELEALFAPGAPVTIDTRTGQVIELVGAGAVGAFIAKAIERFAHFEFAMLNAVADLDEGGDTATGRVYIWEIRADRGTGRWTNAFGLYEDRYTKLGERWVIAQRAYSSLARTAPDLEVFGFPRGQ